MKSPVVKRSIVVAGHKTSVSLEEAFWSGMKEISASRGLTLSVTHQAETVDSVIAAAPRVENRIPDGGNWDGADDPALQARRDTEEQVEEQKQAPST